MQWQQTQQPLVQFGNVPLLTYDVPIIRPTPAKPKRKNPFIRAIKRFVYFKPKTFLGATLFTTIFGIVVTAALQGPTEQHHRPHRTKDKVEQRATPTNTTNKVEKTAKMTEFLTLYNLYSGYQQATQTMVCPTCGDMIAITTASGKEIGATCLTCQKAFQNVKADTQNQKE